MKKEKLEIFEIDEKTNKEILIQLINLYNTVNDSNILKDINSSIEKEEKDELIENYNIRIKAIKKNINKKNYNKKILYQNLTIYDYIKYIDVFIKNNDIINDEEICKIEENSKNFNGDITIFLDNKKKIYIDKAAENKKEKILEFINNNTDKSIKIRIFLNDDNDALNI